MGLCTLHYFLELQMSIYRLLILVIATSLGRAKDNWAILVSTSRFWSNYRDSVNLYFFYDAVKKLGIPDSRIIVFLGEDIPCNARNGFPGKIFAAPPSRSLPVYPLSSAARIDVRSNEVNRQNFLNLLGGKYKPFMPRVRRIGSSAESSVFVYFSGHSAVAYTKFQDFEDVAAIDIAHGFEAMRVGDRYKDLLWIADTCRAASLHNKFYSSNIIALGSSGEMDKAYSHHRVGEIGQSLIDRFTMSTQAAFNKFGVEQISIAQYFGELDRQFLGTVPSLKQPLGMTDVKLIDFLGATDDLKLIRISNSLISPTNPETSTDDRVRRSLLNEPVFTRHQTDGPRYGLFQPNAPVTWNPSFLFPIAIFLGILVRISF